MTQETTKGASYAIGIDLGTTNTETACVKITPDVVSITPEIFEIPQFVDWNVIETRRVLPSALYIGRADEKSKILHRLPWQTDEAGEGGDVEADKEKAKAREKSKKGFFRKVFGLGASEPVEESDPDSLYVVGEFANRQAASAPEKVVVSAKSWLSYPRVDRRAPILPSAASDDMPKVSPVEATRRYLKHVVDAWNDAHPDALIYDQHVVVATPASFDESARELTREAARNAGLNPETTLFIEEPQAATYAWLAQKGEGWRKELKVGDVVLVCDVGGGTTDLTLIRAEEEEGELVLNRLAVGERLLLGGDNVDLALALKAASLFAQKGEALDSKRIGALCRQCREAKERLLSGAVDESATHSIVSQGRASQLVGGSSSVELSKKDVEEIALDGFFPFASLADRPKRRTGVGLRETGLPYEADPAVTKHVARFLSARQNDDGTPIVPTRYLLNGGVFKSRAVAERIDAQLKAWYPDAPPRNMSGDADLDCSVALGAAYYGALKERGGARIRAASPRAYYIGIESSGMAVPGVPRPLKALCVAPIGMEEGADLDVPSDAFELVVGESALFRCFCSSERTEDAPGDVLERFDSDELTSSGDELDETDSVETTLDSYSNDDGAGEPEYVLVRFHTKMTELGALEIWCEEVDGTRKWKLEFNARGE